MKLELLSTEPDGNGHVLARLTLPAGWPLAIRWSATDHIRETDRLAVPCAWTVRIDCAALEAAVRRAQANKSRTCTDGPCRVLGEPRPVTVTSKEPAP